MHTEAHQLSTEAKSHTRPPLQPFGRCLERERCALRFNPRLRKEILSFGRLSGCLALLCFSSSILEGLDSDLAIERSSSEEVGVRRIESRLECPVCNNRELAQLFAAVRIPCDRSVVFAAGQQDVAVLCTPREGQYTLVVRLEGLLGCICVAEVPYQNKRILVIRNGGDEPCRNFGVPRYSADALPAKVIQCKRLLLGPDIPNSDKASTAACRQNVGDLLVPVQRCVLIGVRSRLTQTERLRLVVEVVNVKLALGACGGEDIRSVGIELEG